MVTDLDARSDTYSITSHAPLLRSDSAASNTDLDLASPTKTPSKKWYKKITNPIKKKREKDKSKKALAIAEWTSDSELTFDSFQNTVAVIYIVPSAQLFFKDSKWEYP